MRPFDVEAAKRGEPIQMNYSGEWLDAHFIGLDTAGLVVTEIFGNTIVRREVADMRMKPTKRTVFVQIFDKKGDSDVPGLKAFAFAHAADAKKNLTDTSWPVIGTFPIEIEE